MDKNIHRCCDSCWNKRDPDREPTRVTDDPEDICCSCGSMTASGIYILDHGTLDFCKGNHSEDKPSGGVPYIGFSNETLAKLPPAKEGDTIKCKRCGEPHLLQAAKGGPGAPMLFYHCGGKSYVGGIAGKLIAFQEPDVSG